ncbi:hypothetical protein WN55_10866 [Dufourea novaeangliae]|uniref:Uncharacterized protein n=1 Tax=Dufourea novaeangliae TaxID=178035 RepID=A0A154PA85_DUFNO|nr:hypothetical protein WN55_10866 [Dufourea novaeangliae]
MHTDQSVAELLLKCVKNKLVSLLSELRGLGTGWKRDRYSDGEKWGGSCEVSAVTWRQTIRTNTYTHIHRLLKTFRR